MGKFSRKMILIENTTRTQKLLSKRNQDWYLSNCLTAGFTVLHIYWLRLAKRMVWRKTLSNAFSLTKKTQSIAYYMILESGSLPFRFEKLSTFHKHPYDKTICSQSSSEPFFDISEEERSSLRFRKNDARKMNTGLIILPWCPAIPKCFAKLYMSKIRKMLNLPRLTWYAYLVRIPVFLSINGS